MLDAVMRAANALEGYEVRTFVVHRLWGLTPREVRIEVFDAGPDAGSERFMVTARPATTRT